MRATYINGSVIVIKNTILNEVNIHFCLNVLQIVMCYLSCDSLHEREGNVSLLLAVVLYDIENLLLLHWAKCFDL